MAVCATRKYEMSLTFIIDCSNVRLLAISKTEISQILYVWDVCVMGLLPQDKNLASSSDDLQELFRK